MSQIAAYLIDFDGTLADTHEANYVAYATALSEVGVHIGAERFRDEAFGRHWRQFLPAFLDGAGTNVQPAAIAQRKAEIYVTASRHIRFNEPLIRMLQNRQRRIKAALVTTASRANVLAALSSRPGLSALFDVLITGDDVSRHKPHPQGYLLAAAALGVKPRHCLAFEDSDIGIEAARAAGASVVRVCL